MNNIKRQHTSEFKTNVVFDLHIEILMILMLGFKYKIKVALGKNLINWSNHVILNFGLGKNFIIYTDLVDIACIGFVD